MNRLMMTTALAGSILLAGCANLSPLTSKTPLASGEAHWLTYDSSRRGAYVSTGPDGQVRVCAEPAPDSAYSFVNKLEATVDTANLDANTKAELNATAMELAGRDRTVLVAREALYRLCEFQSNGDLRPGELYDGFQEVMFAVRIMVEADRAKAVSDVGKNSPAAAEALAEKSSKAPQ